MRQSCHMPTLEDSLLNISVEAIQSIFFHGQLEPRKGVMELADAVPLILLNDRNSVSIRWPNIHPYQVLRNRILSKQDL